MKRKIYINKTKVIASLILTVLVIIGLTVFLIRFNAAPITDMFSIIVLVFIIYLIYSCAGLFIKVFRQVPIIIFSDFVIEVSRNFKSESFAWVEIEDWRILKHAAGEEIALTIGGKQKFIEFSDLDTNSSEIQNILETMLPGKEFPGILDRHTQPLSVASGRRIQPDTA